jgi:pyrimidine-nucleoside phosphorylase
MLVYDIICRKRNGKKLTRDEIGFIVKGYAEGAIPDYQMSALLMAIFFRGLDRQETAELTAAMTASGDVLDLSSIKGPKVDKHSTGGVGDGTSLVLAPLVASAGVVVPMMSGRSLGHTGGTLDKLESIPGFKVNLSEAEFRAQLETIGVAIMSQSERVAPADKKIYALRDVTATIDSIGLIAASIMSKKLAEGADCLVLDVKCGCGAFMKSKAQAVALAGSLLDIGKSAGKKMAALVTDMNQPLGAAVGNSLEVEQAIAALKGKGPEDFVELVIELGSMMLVIAGAEKNIGTAKKTLKANLENGKALKKFAEIISAQGGDSRVIDRPGDILPKAKFEERILANRSGFVSSIQTEEIGLAAMMLGAGRKSKETRIDHSAGFVINKKLGDRVERGELIASMYYNAGVDAEAVRKRVISAYEITPRRKRPSPLIRRIF